MPAPARSAAPAAAPTAASAQPAAPPTAALARVPPPAPAPSKPSAGPPAIRLASASIPASEEVPGFSGGGDPLAPALRGELESTLQVDLGAVRVHTSAHAREVALTLSARAVTYGNHIFLGPGAGPNDSALMAHEVTHVVQQQGAVPRPQRWGHDATDPYEQEAHRASAAVAEKRPFIVRERTRKPRPQRLGLSDVLDYFADKANNIPGFRMFTIVLGVNPINWSRVERTPANILRAVVEFIPGGNLITQALDNYGIFDKIGNWVSQQLATLGNIGSAIKQAISDFLDSLGWRDIFRLGSVWNRAKRIFTDPIGRIISFVKGLVTGIIRFIKEAILRPLAKLAEGTRGYDLLKAVLGEDPVTGDKVPRNADTLIGGFMKLIGKEEVWNNLKKANAVSRAWAWFQGALGGLLGFVRQIPRLFISALQSLVLADIILVPRAFAKVVRVFAGFVGQFFSWALQQVLQLLQIIFEVLAPAVMPYIRKAAAAFKKIVSDPVGFIRNLVRAGIQGFRQFASNFLTHLRTALIQWLTGTLSGANIYIPKAFEIREIIKFVLSVLGLTWQNIRQKLVRVIGETAVTVLETTFDIVVTLVREGPAAAWEKIKEQLSNLKEMVMGEVMNFVRDRIVQAAITKLVTSLNPAGAFIQAIIAIYNTIMFFVERLRQIAQVVASFIDSISAIANGVIGAAANRVERTMAGLLTLVISFLARLVGLGRVSDAVVNIVNKIRAPIDRALDRVIEWIVNMARRAGRLLVSGARAVAAGAQALVLRFTRPKSFSAAGERHQMWISESGEPQVSSAAMPLGTRIGTWRRRVRTLAAAQQGTATAQIDTCAQINAELRRAAADALRARAASNAPAVDAAQAIIDRQQAALQPVLTSLFMLFGDTATAEGAEDEARIFALMEVYDQVVVPLGTRGLIAGRPASVSRSFRGLWNGKRIPQARGFVTHMERVLAAARNVGTDRFPVLTGVEVKIPQSRVDYTVRDRDLASNVALDAATEVKHWGAIRDRRSREGRIITVAEQVQQRIATLRNQLRASLNSQNPSYSVVTLEVRGVANIPQELRDALASVLVDYRNLARTLNKRFVYRRI